MTTTYLRKSSLSIPFGLLAVAHGTRNTERRAKLVSHSIVCNNRADIKGHWNVPRFSHSLLRDAESHSWRGFRHIVSVNE